MRGAARAAVSSAIRSPFPRRTARSREARRPGPGPDRRPRALPATRSDGARRARPSMPGCPPGPEAHGQGHVVLGGVLVGQDGGQGTGVRTLRGQGVHDRERLLVLAQVAGRRLAGDLPARPRSRARRRPPGRRSPRGGRSARSASTCASEPPPRMPPSAAAQEISAPVLLRAICRHSSSSTSRRDSNDRSWDWPSIISQGGGGELPGGVMGLGRRRRAGPRTRAPPERRPTTIASPTPNSAHTVGRWRRSASPSMRSS